MSARIPEGFWELTVHFAAPGQAGDVITQLGWLGDPPFLSTEQEAVQGAFSLMMGNINHNVIARQLSFTFGGTGEDDLTVDRTVNIPGEALGDMIPVNTAYLMQKRSALGGRRNRGRNYWPGVSEGSVGDDGLVSPAVRSGLQSNWDDFRDAMATAGHVLVIFHQSAPWTPTTVDVVNFASKVATQRARLR